MAGQVQAEVLKPCALAADGSGQVHGQGADAELVNDGVAALDECVVQMGQILVDVQVLHCGPDLGTKVAADKKRSSCRSV